MKYTKHISLALILAMLLMLTTGCGKSGSVGSADAGSMKLEAFEGTAHVTDESGSEADAREHMNLYSGYGVGTEQTSYAWIDLDADKMLKLDEVSQAGLSQEDKHLRITLEQGAMFFCLQKLAEDETMEIETGGENGLTLALRGTTGFLQLRPDGEIIVGLYEGRIEATYGGESFILSTGEKARITAGKDGKPDIQITELDYVKDTPGFVMDELFKEDARDKLDASEADTSALNEIEKYNDLDAAEEMRTRLGDRSHWKGDNVAHLDIVLDADRTDLLISGGTEAGHVAVPFGIHAYKKDVIAIGDSKFRIYGEPSGTRFPDGRTVFNDPVYIITISGDNNSLTLETYGNTYTVTRSK